MPELLCAPQAQSRSDRLGRFPDTATLAPSRSRSVAQLTGWFSHHWYPTRAPMRPVHTEAVSVCVQVSL